MAMDMSSLSEVCVKAGCSPVRSKSGKAAKGKGRTNDRWQETIESRVGNKAQDWGKTRLKSMSA